LVGLLVGWKQGDHEREQGLPCSPYMDRYHPDEAKSQAMFITKIVQPLYELLTALAPSLAPQLLANLNANRSLVTFVSLIRYHECIGNRVM
jgi:hypothetical protein